MVAVAMAALAGCGGGGGSSLANLTRDTTLAGTARFSIVKTVSPGGSYAATGVIDWRHDRLRSSTVGGRHPETTVVLGTTADYVREVPASDRRDPARPWVQLDPAGGFASTDPAAQLDLLRAVTGPATRIGPGHLAGGPTTVYRAVVDVARLAADDPVVANDGYLRGRTAVPVSIWLDGRGRVRQLQDTFTMTPAAARAEGLTRPASVTTTVDFTDFGLAVHVTAPPADQVSPPAPGPGLLGPNPGAGGS
jgi:hypothetical protein